MSTQETVAGRAYARVYRTSGKADIHDFISSAVDAAGGRLLYTSAHSRAPIYLGLEALESERIGVLCYPFRATGKAIKNRPKDEHRVQIRYGSEASWLVEHPLGLDVAMVDVTIVVGVDVAAGIFVGLDPLVYDPLPMGISIEFKKGDVKTTVSSGWHVWQRTNRAGLVRPAARAEAGLETIVAFTPSRLIDYIRLEREAASLALDPVLRRKAALAAGQQAGTTATRHILEDAFHMRSLEMLDVIAKRKRLRVAMRGGVAEHHLARALAVDRGIARVEEVDNDGPPDLRATLVGGSVFGVECKNGEDSAYADGAGRVEVQKTRASKGDPASRYYKPDQFDVLAVCLWPETGGPPRFVFRLARDLERHRDFPERLAVMHRIDKTWTSSLTDLVT